MAGPTRLDEVVEKKIKQTICEKFNLDAASEIVVPSIEVDHVEHKIRIEVLITTNERPEALAKSYFGLTGKVRDALGSDWSGFFPVITPQINSAGMHA